MGGGRQMERGGEGREGGGEMRREKPKRVERRGEGQGEGLAGEGAMEKGLFALARPPWCPTLARLASPMLHNTSLLSPARSPPRTSHLPLSPLP